MTNFDVNLSNSRTEVTLGCDGCPKRRTLAFSSYPGAITTGITVDRAPIDVQSYRTLTIVEGGWTRASQQYQEGYTQIASYCIDKTSCPNEIEIEDLQTAYLERVKKNVRG